MIYKGFSVGRFNIMPTSSMTYTDETNVVLLSSRRKYYNLDLNDLIDNMVYEMPKPPYNPEDGSSYHPIESVISKVQRVGNDITVWVWHQWPEDQEPPERVEIAQQTALRPGESRPMPTHTIKIAQPETHAQWVARVEPRITVMSRCFADGLPSQYARLATLTQKIHSSGIGENHRHGDRYDSAANVGQHAIGFLRWQFEKIRDNNTEDLFKTKAELEADLTTLEDIVGDEAWVKDFYLKHNSTRWSARSTRGIIHLPNENFDFGEKIHDTFRPLGNDQSFTRSGPSEEVEEAARKSEAELATICEKFGDALHSQRSELVESRQVTLSKTANPTHNADLSSLVVSTDVGALDLMAPFNSGAPDGFDPDRTEYVVLVPVGKNAVGIVASAEHSGATVTGIGDVQITDRSETITKTVIVTSEDTLVSKTYTITIISAT